MQLTRNWSEMSSSQMNEHLLNIKLLILEKIPFSNAEYSLFCIAGFE